MAFAEALTTLGSTIEARVDSKGHPAPRGLGIASQENGFLWNQRLSRKLLITLEGEKPRAATIFVVAG